MKRFVTIFSTTVLLVMPSQALTLEQAMNEVAGYHCSGSSCNKSTESIETRDLPDLVTESQELVRGEIQEGPAPHSSLPNSNCPLIRTMNGGWAVQSNVTADCVPMSINSLQGGGHPAVYRTVTTTTDGGTTDVTVCTTTTKELTYNGPNTDRANAWSVSSSESSSDGSC